jgi:hypothetical protein
MATEKLLNDPVEGTMPESKQPTDDEFDELAIMRWGDDGGADASQNPVDQEI